jgi:hypothetical protein
MACPPGGSTIGTSVIGNVTAHLAGGNNAVLQIVGVEHFFQTYGTGVQIAPGESAIRRKTCSTLLMRNGSMIVFHWHGCVPKVFQSSK